MPVVVDSIYREKGIWTRTQLVSELSEAAEFEFNSPATVVLVVTIFRVHAALARVLVDVIFRRSIASVDGLELAIAVAWKKTHRRSLDGIAARVSPLRDVRRFTASTLANSNQDSRPLSALFGFTATCSRSGVLPRSATLTP